MSLRARLLWMVLPFLALAVLVLAVGMSWFSRQTVLRQAMQDGQLLSSVLARSIEVSQSTRQGMEFMIARDLMSSAGILAHFVAVAEACQLPAAAITERLRSMVSPDNLSEIWITDVRGHAYLHTVPDIDFQFSPDPALQPQASAFWPLLSPAPPPAVVQQLKPREVDGQPFKYVGVPGVDQPRIVQVGLDGRMLAGMLDSLGVQELLDHIVEEGDIQRVWVVNRQAEVENMAMRGGAGPKPAPAKPDLRLLRDVMAQGRAGSRLDEDYIAIAAPLALLPNLADGGGRQRPDAKALPTGALLLHVSMGMLDRLLVREVWVAIATAALALLLGTWLAAAFARRIVRPVELAAAAAEKVSAGDLTVELVAPGRDEIGKLINALGRMVAYLNALIGQVQRSTIDLVSTANSLSAMSKTQSEEVNNLGSTTTEIAAATQEISATSEELLGTMAGLTQVADQTTALANAGQASLGHMEGAMRALAEATQSISGRLGLINEKANTIGSVTTTITRIADQTNLLSLNASIEAEKAGEYGLGFAVLAREIRRLADQTAVATLDIEQMVKEMQDSVTGGVMEMDKFAEQVNRSVADTGVISQRFGEIIQQVQALLPQFDAVHEGMRAQSAGARQIRDAMVSLTESVRVSVRALEATTTATHRLEGAIDELRGEISAFRLRGEG